MLLALTLLGCIEPPEPYPEIWVSWDDGTGPDRPVNTWAEVPLMSDLVWYETGKGLGIDVTNRAVIVLDLTNGQILRSIPLSGEPKRLAWSAEQGIALVTQIDDGTSRLFAVDIDAGTSKVVPLTFGGRNYPAYDAAWSEDSSHAWVLGYDENFSLANHVVKLDVETRTITEVYELFSGFAGWTIQAADGDIYVGHGRFDLDAFVNGRLEEVASYPKNVFDPHRLQLSADGMGTLWPDSEILYEVDRGTGEIAVTYPHDETWGIHGPEQWIYNHGDNHVYTVGLDWDEHQVQRFDRATGEQTLSWYLPGPEYSRAIFYDLEILFMEPDDSRLYLYCHQDFNHENGFIKWVDFTDNEAE